MGKILSSSRIKFCWLTNFACNYRCPYCFSSDKWDVILQRDKFLSVDEVISVWRRIFDRYGEVHIELSGGEPFQYPHIIEILKELLVMHTIGISTNLSFNAQNVIDNLNPARIKIGASFHPLCVPAEDFLASVDLLRRNNWSVGVVCVAWPPLINSFAYYRSLFGRHDFSVLPFWGIYQGKQYPGSYTADEKDIIERFSARRQEVLFSPQPQRVSGRICRAGQVYAHIMPDGEMLRCGFGGESMGRNFFDPDFSLFDAPVPCKSEYCGCLEWTVCE